MKKLIGRVPREAVMVLVLLLASTGSFGLGVLAGRESREGEMGDRLWIEKLEEVVEPAAAHIAAEEEDIPPKASPKKEVPPPPSGGGEVVASKSGTKYYLPWCGSVKRIKEENKVWFASKAEAEAAGYEPAKNCRGL